MDKNPEINSEIGKKLYEQIKRRTNYLFKDVLDSADDIKGKIINYAGDKDESFKILRKKLLDRGNDTLNIIELFLNECEIVGIKSIVQLSDKLREEIKEEK